MVHYHGGLKFHQLGVDHSLLRSTDVNVGTLSPNAFFADPLRSLEEAPWSPSVGLKMALFDRPKLGTVAPSGRSCDACGMGMDHGV